MTTLPVEDFKHPTNEFPIYEILTAEGLEKIHQTSMQILSEVGIAFYDEDAKRLCRENGLKVDEDIVYFDPEMVMEYIAKAPSQFTQISRHPQRSVSIGGNHMVFAPVYGPPFVYDIQNGRHIATLEDFQNFVKLAYLSPYLHHSGGTVVEPNDIPVDVRHLHMLFAHIKFSDKPFMGSVTSPENARDSVELCKILYGEDRIRDNPALISLININSPRQFDDRMLGALKVYAQENQATIITPFVLAGAMAPVTIAGAIAQQNAEILAGIVYSQMINPGAPVVYGSFSTNMDFLSGSPVLGSPESQKIISISGQLARKYNLPYRSGGMFTSSKLTDTQAATESMMTMLPTINSHVNFVLHAAGWLDSGMVAGYEKFMLDCEVLGMLHKYLEGIDLSEEALALEVQREVPPGGHFLITDHTLRNFRTAYYQAELFDHKVYDSWVAAGSRGALQLANDAYRAALADYQAPELDAAIEEELLEYINIRSGELVRA